jgi:hypothetical protein
MKTHVSLLLGVFTLSLGLTHAREFTDKTGRKLDAELLSVASPNVTLKRAADGRAITAPISLFSEEDQKFIQDFAARAYAPKPWKMGRVISVRKAGSRAQRLRLLRKEPFSGLLLSTLTDISRIKVKLCAAVLSLTWQ